MHAECWCAALAAVARYEYDEVCFWECFGKRLGVDCFLFECDEGDLLLVDLCGVYGVVLVDLVCLLEGVLLEYGLGYVFACDVAVAVDEQNHLWHLTFLVGLFGEKCFPQSLIVKP